MKTIFLDFDGVLHTSSIYIQTPFSKLSHFDPLLKDYAFDVVVSSTWRFHYKLNDLKLKLRKLGERVIGVTGESCAGTFPRYYEIREYAEFNQILDWVAIDDAKLQFPESEKRLIHCNPQTGITNIQIQILKDWLET
ncbi:MAG: hypothetical protein CBC60_02120 [Betaproteobacteria bacterium TMED100]|nr:MAG: hypothetical protein CBC60_02120 [Betaproteobacteria bacterium TMED100]|tara:strand:- start:193 stop:603 length:411 start_codon:yes stop_codon:yes gene_type:complete